MEIVISNEKKPDQSGIDGVTYRRAKMWQIILVSMNAFIGMSFYSLIGLASYSASIGFGIATVAVGGILTFTRIFDAITDPILAFVYDKINTRFRKVRVLMASGWLIMVLSVLFMYNQTAGKGHGIVMFVILYVIYIIGYTLFNMTGQTLYALMTNAPKQRPIPGVYSTIFNYIVPIALSLIFYTKLMPKYGGFNLEFLAAACWTCIALSAIGIIAACIGISDFDKPENFIGTTAKRETLKFSDMSIYVTVATIAFFCFLHMGGNTRSISVSMPLMGIYVVLTLLTNATKMCVTTVNNAFMADVIDYELDRGGKIYPGCRIRRLQPD